MTEPLLDITGLETGYPQFPVINGLDLRIGAGERVALVGPNGCGKSTLIRAVLGTLPSTSGTIRFENQDITSVPTEQRVRAGMRYLRQSRNTFPQLTVRENLELAASWFANSRKGLTRMSDIFEILHPRPRVRSFSQPPDLHDHAILALLSDRMDERAGVLSGGQRQALAIAMTLAHTPVLLALDEPVAGVSKGNTQTILETIGALQQKEKFAMLVVEHNLRAIQPWVDRVVLMMRGQIVEDTADTSLLTDQDRLRQYFLG